MAAVTVLRNIMHIIAATLLALIAGTIALVLFGVLLPVWSMILIYGRQQVQDAPAHGGVILFLTIPAVGLMVLVGMFPFGAFVYRKLSRS
jgi:hypothetical protein